MSLGPLHADFVSDFEVIQVLTHLSSFGELGKQGPVHFDDKTDLADHGIIGRGRIRSLDGFSILVLELNRHVLPRRQSEYVTRW